MPLKFTTCMLAIMLAFSMACMRKQAPENQPEDATHRLSIKGVIAGASAAEVILEEMEAREYIPVDTVLCDASGAFEIDFTADRPAFYVLRYGQTGYVTLLMEPGESLVLKAELENRDNYSVQGSPGSELLRELAAEHKKTLNALGEITRKNRQNMSSPGYAELKIAFDQQFDSITARFKQYSLAYIENNSGSLAILVALYNLYGQGLPVFHPGEDLQVYKFVDSVLMNQYSEFDAVKLLHAQIAESEQLIHENQASESLLKGKIAPDFVSSRPDGSQLALSELKGSYVLLNFWAGWSHLSRKENAVLREAMESFANKNLRVLQVSLDDKREVWLQAIQEDNLDWDHVSDLKRWECPAVDLYRVDKVPFHVLIDPSGRILETNIFGEELLNKLENLFNS
jgi:peroxiredoxin